MWALGLVLLAPFSVLQEDEGRIEGRVLLTNGTPVPGVTVELTETPETRVSDPDGAFVFDELPPGTYTVTFRLGQHSASEPTVRVIGGRATSLAKVVDWQLLLLENVTVVSASRRPERIVDAPAAITRIGAEEIELRSGRSGIPELVELTPGVELTQQDVGDYNFNTRGFNNTLTRRVAVFIDGRATSSPALAHQNWPAMTFPLEDFESVELVRGPSAALYGVNASSGVLNLTTKAPRDSLGMSARLMLGERGTAETDFRLATELGRGWYMKITGFARHMETFAVPRHDSVEYSVPCQPMQIGDCLPLDAVDIEEGNTLSRFAGGVRFDKYFEGDRWLTLEGATSTGTCCGVTATGVGRFRLENDGTDSWARVNLDWDRWNLLAYLNSTNVSATGAADGGRLVEGTSHVEAQRNWELDSGRWSMVAGGLYDRRHGEGFAGPAFVVNSVAAYAQIDRRLTDSLNLVVTGRVEDSTIHDTQFSPRASLVWRFQPGQTLRFTYNQAFQSPAPGEIFMELDVAPPADLGTLEDVCQANGVSCGLGPTRVVGVGNANLEVEHVRAFEVGYRGLLGTRTFFTADAYVSRNQDFISNLLPQVGTPLGRLNEDYGAWEGPPEAESTTAGFCPAPGFGSGSVADCVRRLVPELSNFDDGTSVVVPISYTNFGTVDTRGVEIGLTHVLTSHWQLDGALNWFDFDIKEEVTGFPDLLLPNAPPWQLALGVRYSDERWLASLRGRWVDRFRWSTGIFIGDVEPYSTVDLDAQYRVAPDWTVGVSATNLLNDVHYEFFGAPLLRRWARVYVTFRR